MKMTRNQKIARIVAALRRRQMTRQQIAESTGIPLESVCGRCNGLLMRRQIEVAKVVLHPETGAYREVLRVRREAEA